MAQEPLFPGLEQGLMDAQEHQQRLAAAVESRKLWMEAGVADEAAQCCDQAVDNLNVWLQDARVLTRRLPFGDNQDGYASVEVFRQAGEKYLEVMQDARDLFFEMAATYRMAGGLMEHTEQDVAQGFERGIP